MKIYYSVAIRSRSISEPLVNVYSQISILESLGHQVLTKKLLLASLSADSRDVKSLEKKSDEEIYCQDQELLRDCDVMIAEVSSPSLGVGIMIANALHLQKPVLTIYTIDARKNPDFSLSAMIRGDQRIIIRRYSTTSVESCVDINTNDDSCVDSNTNQDKNQDKNKNKNDESFEKIVPLVLNQLKNRFNIVIRGLPGSGKSTLAKRLAQELNMIHISSGQVLRDLVSSKGPKWEDIKQKMDKGYILDAKTMKSVLTGPLQSSDATLHGVILDGYPPTFGMSIDYHL